MPAPQIKQDLNRSGWETTDFPSSCESCLPDNPYVQMLKEDYGAECKICTRPFTVFKWKTDRTARTKRTNICLTCARLKNCCQSCMLDLSFGLPLSVRDAALRMIAPGPTSDVNREYYAQEHEKEIEEGRAGIDEAYAKTDDKARDLLRRLANSQPYYRKQRQLEDKDEEDEEGQPAQKRIAYGPGGNADRSDRPTSTSGNAIGPVRTSDNKKAAMTAPPRRARPMAGARAPQPEDWLPPQDPNVISLFVTGVEDDLPEHALRTFFTKFGQLRSLVCSHRSHCAFVNYAKREDAEKAAAECQGKAIVQGCPLRVRWGKPKPLDNTDRDQRLEWAKEGRQTAAGVAEKEGGVQSRGKAGLIEGTDLSNAEDADSFAVVAPPGRQGGSVPQYASLAGD